METTTKYYNQPKSKEKIIVWYPDSYIMTFAPKAHRTSQKRGRGEKIEESEKQEVWSQTGILGSGGEATHM